MSFLLACAMQVHMAAYHFEPGYNNAVPGIGVLCDTPTEDTRLVAGVFRNSIRKTSAYAGLVWQPIHIGPVKIGGVAGLVSGYYHGVEPLGALAVSFPITQNAEGHVTAIPKVDDRTPATVQFSISVKF